MYSMPALVTSKQQVLTISAEHSKHPTPTLAHLNAQTPPTSTTTTSTTTGISISPMITSTGSVDCGLIYVSLP